MEAKAEPLSTREPPSDSLYVYMYVDVSNHIKIHTPPKTHKEDHPPRVQDSDGARDGGGGPDVVARDHHHAHARAVAGGDGLIWG